MRNILLFIFTILTLVFFNFSIYSQEKVIREGQTVYFELAPYDPRSLMQGDYMDLRYELENILASEPHVENYSQAVLKLDSNSKATFSNFYNDSSKLTSDEVLIKFEFADNHVRLQLTSSYFFEEGSASKFANAKYGIFKYQNRDYILVGLTNEDMKIIE